MAGEGLTDEQQAQIKGGRPEAPVRRGTQALIGTIRAAEFV